MKTQNTSEDEGNALGGKAWSVTLRDDAIVLHTEFTDVLFDRIPGRVVLVEKVAEIHNAEIAALAPSPTSQPNETQESANAETPTTGEQAPGSSIDTLRDIRERIRTQDNDCTADQLFIVEQRERIYGLKPQWSDKTVWIDDEGECEPTAPGASKTNYADRWKFVTACFTRKGCEDYIAVNGHNLKEPRIYTASAYRNREWQTIRAFLLALPPQPSVAPKELEELRLRLCQIGLDPGHYDTMEKAVEGAFGLVKTLREHIAEPAPDIQEHVIRKLDLVPRASSSGPSAEQERDGN